MAKSRSPRRGRYWLALRLASGSMGESSASYWKVMILVSARQASWRNFPMNLQSCSITTESALPGSSSYFLSFVCASCGHYSFVTIRPKRDGIVRLSYPRPCHGSQSSQSRPSWVLTPGERLLISCESCGHCVAECLISKADDGTSFTLQNSGNLECVT